MLFWRAGLGLLCDRGVYLSVDQLPSVYEKQSHRKQRQVGSFQWKGSPHSNRNLKRLGWKKVFGFVTSYFVPTSCWRTELQSSFHQLWYQLVCFWLNCTVFWIFCCLYLEAKLEYFPQNILHLPGKNSVEFCMCLELHSNSMECLSPSWPCSRFTTNLPLCLRSKPLSQRTMCEMSGAMSELNYV